MRRVNTQIKKGADNLTIEAISSLYNYRAVAAVRENISNAIDAHTEAGQTAPVDVTLIPNNNAVRIIVADTGIGMTTHEVENDYLSIEVSRKRTKDDLIGGHGVGVLATFAATGSMTVISTKEGATTTAHGVNHGYGDIEWTIDALDEPLPDTGTTVDFTLDTTRPELNAVVQYVLMLTYLHNIRLTVAANEADTSFPLNHLFVSMREMESAMMVSHDKSHTTIYPHALLEHPERTTCAFDTDFILGHKIGLIACPAHFSNTPIATDFVMPVVGGLPYRMGVSPIVRASISRANMHDEEYVLMATEKWINNSPLADMEVVAIPRNREYIEVDTSQIPLREVATKATDENAFEVTNAAKHIRRVVDANMDYIVENFPLLHDLHSNTAGGLLTCLMERAVAASLGASDVRLHGPLTTHVRAFNQSPRLNMSTFTMGNSNSISYFTPDALEVLEELYCHLRNTSARACIGSPNSVLNSEVAEQVQEVLKVRDELTIGSALEILFTQAHSNKNKAKYQTSYPDSSGSAQAEYDFKDSIVPVVCSTTEDLPTVWDKDTCSAVASHLGRKARIVVAFDEPDDKASVRLFLFNYLVSNYALSISRVPSAEDGFLNYLGAHHMPNLAINTLLYYPGAEVEHTSWKKLSTEIKREKKEKQWSFKRLDLSADGTYTTVETTLTTAQGRKLADDSVSLFMPASNHRQTFYKETKRQLSHDTLPETFNESQKRAQYSALYAAGYRTIYVYVDKPSTVLSKISRKHWIKPWVSVVLPALMEKKKDERSEAVQKNIAGTIFNRLNPSAAIPSHGDLSNYLTLQVYKTFTAAGFGDDRARNTARAFSSVVSVYSPLYRALAEYALDKNPQVPREFVLPYYVASEDSFSSDRKMYDNRNITPDVFEAACADYTATTADVLEECGTLKEKSWDSNDAYELSGSLGLTSLTSFHSSVCLLTNNGVNPHAYTTSQTLEASRWVRPNYEHTRSVGVITNQDVYSCVYTNLRAMFSSLVELAWSRFIEGVDLRRALGTLTHVDAQGVTPLVREVYEVAGAVEFIPESDDATA